MSFLWISILKRGFPRKSLTYDYSQNGHWFFSTYFPTILNNCPLLYMMLLSKYSSTTECIQDNEIHTKWTLFSIDACYPLLNLSTYTLIIQETWLTVGWIFLLFIRPPWVTFFISLSELCYRIYETFPLSLKYTWERR